MANRARSAFEVDGLRNEMGGGRKEGCLQRKWEQWPLSALFHPLSPFLSHIERTQKVFECINTPVQNVRTRLLISLGTHKKNQSENHLSQIKKLPPTRKINHFLLIATHWGLWWWEQVCVTKASFQLFPIGERCDVQKQGQACAVYRACIQALKLLVCFNS